MYNSTSCCVELRKVFSGRTFLADSSLLSLAFFLIGRQTSVFLADAHLHCTERRTNLLNIVNLL